jgi:hypothetical protein
MVALSDTAHKGANVFRNRNAVNMSASKGSVDPTSFIQSPDKKSVFAFKNGDM